MLDINLLRKDLAWAVARLETRKNPQAFLDVPAFSALEAERKTIQTRAEDLQARRNSLSKQIDQSMGALSKAIHKGFDDFKWLLKDPDLGNLRKHPAFKKIWGSLSTSRSKVD